MKNILEGGIIQKGGNSKENQTGKWSSRKAFIDQKKCIKCHQCVLFCPEGCINIGEKNEVTVDENYCKGCMVCAVECPMHAIRMVEKE